MFKICKNDNSTTKETYGYTIIHERISTIFSGQEAPCLCFRTSDTTTCHWICVHAIPSGPDLQIHILLRFAQKQKTLSRLGGEESNHIRDATRAKILYIK